MKMRPLPVTDLARFAPLSREQKYKKLSSYGMGFPDYNYNPVRASFSDLLNEKGPLASDMLSAPWGPIEQTIIHKSKNPDEEEVNLDIARPLFRFRESYGITSRREKFAPIAFGPDMKVFFWLQYVVNIGGEGVIVFIDPRRRGGLGPAGRKFVFSVMDARIRALNPDFKNLRLCVVKFTDADQREVNPIFFDESELYPVEEIVRMVGETYQVWAAILEERASKAHRRVGGSGSLL